MVEEWREYQEKAASLFRNMGMDAQTDVTLNGVRTAHDIDVLVKSHHMGFDVVWIVECKQWEVRVSKLHVLALREIVSDLGADRGILLAENGFQSGAMEAAALTNVHLTSLANVQRTAHAEVFAMRLRETYDLVQLCKQRYWDIPKQERIESGLRPEVMESGFSGAALIEIVDDLLKKAFRGVYPINSHHVLRHGMPQLPIQFESAESLLTAVNPLISELEQKLNAFGGFSRPTN